MAEVLLSPFLQMVMEKAADHLLQQFTVIWGIEEKLEKLERMLLAIQDVVGDAEQRQIKEAGVKSWLAGLKNAAYEADDILDEFKLEAMRRKVEIQVDMRKKVRSFFSFHNPVSFRFKMGKNLKDIVEKIEEIANERNIFHFKVKTQPQNKPQTHSYVVESDVVGREKEKEKIVKLLLDHDTNHNVAVFPIVGMGGLGKTTLAKLIYKDEDVKKHFQPLVWVCASDEFDVAKLVKAIIASARATQCQESNMELSKVKMASGRGTEGQESNMESLQLGLREVIGGKRYLLVLDDVWNEDQVKWDELKALLGTGGEGSRIIVTARSEQVSRIMGAREAYRLDFLSENDSWELFTKRANPPQHLESIGKEIVKKCGGLPLAVKTLGSLMQSKSQKSEWLSVRNSKIWDMQVGEDGILPALRLSYSHLPSHLKQCFAFCAIFPKDYQMQKDLLIQLWMANGFIPSGGSKELEVKGHEIFNELASRSFFQDIKEVTEDDGYEGRHQPYCITTCKMHDLMHDLAQSIMGNECLSMVDPAMLEAASRKTRHLGSFQYFQSNIHKIPLNNYPNIRTLVCQATVTADSSKPRSLRALGLHGYNIRRLPISIRFLKHLRYLDLSRTRIEALPDATSTLFNLQTLKLSNCWKLRKLPEDMRNMSSLRHLYIDSCHRLKHLPAGIGQLSSLRTLTKYIVGNDDGRRIGELNSLDLGGFLELYDLGNVRDAADAKYANLSSKHNLRSLILCWDMITWDVPHCYGKNGLYNCKDVLPAKNAEEVLEALRPSVGLKLLAIWRYGGDRFPKWMMDFMLRQLVEIHLGVCTGCEHLPPLWQLPLLKFLYLFKMDSLKHICNSTIYGNASNGAVQAFPKLQRLVLHTMQSLKEWSKDEKTAQVMLVLPHLAELKIINCPNLVTIPELPSLKSLEMKGTNKQLGWVGRLTTLSSLDIELNKTSNGTESPPLAQKEISFRDFRFLENLTITASDDLAPLLKEEKTKVLSSSLHRLEFTRCNWLFSSSQQASSPLGLWKNLTSLRSLRIQYCDDLVYWPEEEFHGLNSLKTLTIRYCNNLLGPLSSSSSGDGELLPNLEELTIGYCNGLLELPKLPASLRSLRVNGCPKMAMMEGLRHATALDNLSICDCSSLTSLPLELTHLNVLTSLCLWNLFGLTCLPQGFGQLTALKSLDIDNCSNLSSLPEGMQGLTALQDLDLTSLPRLTCLPQGFGQLTALKSLDISDCSNLSYLAEGMQGLTALQYLSIRRCPQLSSLPEGLRQQLPDLQHLFVGECPILEKQYRRGGPYWYLVSRIPNIEIVSETRSNFSTLFPSFSCFRRPSTFESGCEFKTTMYQLMILASILLRSEIYQMNNKFASRWIKSVHDASSFLINHFSNFLQLSWINFSKICKSSLVKWLHVNLVDRFVLVVVKHLKGQEEERSLILFK